MPNAFERHFNLPRPQCCSTGDCCKGVSPSTPTAVLRQRMTQYREQGRVDDFAETFFSLMVPYPSHEAARAVVPGVVEATLRAAANNPAFNHSTQEVVFYHCRYLLPNNRCGVHEDRPDFCRDYPDTPFLVMAPNCAYVPWAKACKQRYAQLQEQSAESLEALDTLKALQGQVAHGTALTTAMLDEALTAEERQTLTDANWPWVISLTNLWVGSPGTAFWWR